MEFDSLRITFWGTQGSLPYFPVPDQFTTFADRVGVDVLQRLLTEAQSRFGSQPFTLDDLIGGPLDEASVRRLLQRVGYDVPPSYGGETTCAEVETADGSVFLIDGGSGLRHFARQRVRQWRDRDDRTLYWLGTHEHLDHRLGIPFAAICYAQPPFKLQIFGNYGFLAAMDDRLGVFSECITERTYHDDPLDYNRFTANFSGTQLLHPEEPLETGERVRNCTLHDASKPLTIGETVITAFPLYHGSTPCLGYKFEHRGRSFVFCTDHELRHGSDPDHPNQLRSLAAEERVRHHCQGADIAYFDGQYFRDEYLGTKGLNGSPGMPRIDWGHGCVEDVIERATICGIGQTFIGHHDPDREWFDRVELDRFCQAESARIGHTIRLARDRMVVEI